MIRVGPNDGMNAYARFFGRRTRLPRHVEAYSRRDLQALAAAGHAQVVWNARRRGCPCASCREAAH